MMAEEEIRTRLVQVMAEEFELDPAQLVPEATLYEDLGLDSLDAVDMVVALEKAFAMKLTNEESIRTVRTIDDLLRLLMQLREEHETKA